MNDVAMLLNDKFMDYKSYRNILKNKRQVYIHKKHKEISESEAVDMKYHELIDIIEHNYCLNKKNNINLVLKDDKTDMIDKKDTDQEVTKVKNSVLMLKQQLSFFLISSLTIILSLIGMIVFMVTGFYILHPAFYILLFLMGLGWEATAIYSLKTKNKE